MKSFDLEFKKYTEKVTLKVSERRALRERILSYMEYHPLPKQERALRRDVILSDAFVLFDFKTLFKRAGVIAVIAVIVIPTIAERAVPGDVLYVVKRGINESIQGSLASTPYEKIEFETRLMERRITEARVLADAGKLTEDVKTEIAKTVKEHSTVVQESIAELRVQDADGAAIAQIAYSSSLEVQSAMLSGGAPEGGEMVTMAMTQSVGDIAIDPILSVVNEARDEIANDQTNPTPSFDTLLASLETETTRAFELFESIKKTATAEEIVDIERRMSDTHRLIEEGKQKKDIDEGVAVGELTDTLQQVQKLVLFMNDINIRNIVTLDAIVPIVLSDEERRVIAKQELEDVVRARQDILEKVVRIPDEDIVLKIHDGMVTADERIGVATRALEQEQIEVAEPAIADARAYMNDLFAITLGALPIEVPIEIPVDVPPVASSTEEQTPADPTAGEDDTLETGGVNVSDVE